jgi:glucosamine--fructose-6-phosphate aminotransferase (isomerizing)
MCGIVGYTGPREAQRILIAGLKKLQYRGYDSCGIAIRSQQLEVFKEVGTVEKLEANSPQVKGRTGIGHTRWATHGGVSQINAHPHLDCTGKIAVVHNGVLTNYASLRDQMMKEGHVFHSETDTEVISHLIERYYHGSLVDAVSRTIVDLEGTFAFVALHQDEPRLVGSRRECPLIAGLSEKAGNFISSDVLAFLETTNRALYLEDGDIAVVSDNEVIVTRSGSTITRPEIRIEWEAEELRKSGYEHFMLKEIHEQPKVIDRALWNRIKYFESINDTGVNRISNLSSIQLIACGTSYHAAMIGELVMSRLSGLPARAVIASEFRHPELLPPNSLLIGISQSGETADTLISLKKAQELGISIMAITNVPGSSLTRLSEQVLFTNAGPEVAVAATKTFTAQLVALYLVALDYASSGIDVADSIRNNLRLVSGKVQEVLDSEDLVSVKAKILSNYRDCFLIARGINYPVALEGALKLKEIAYVHAEAFPAGELKHGPFALLDTNTPVIAIITEDENRDSMLTTVKEIKARGAPVYAIAPQIDDYLEQLVDGVIRVPAIPPMLSPFVNVVVLQLLSYYIGKVKGCPIDMPVNLAKSVTVP